MSKKNKSKTKQPKVFISTLSPGMVFHDYARDLASVCLEDGGRTIKAVNQIRTARSFQGRNRAIMNFLESDCDWLLWIDSDMSFGYRETYLPLLDEIAKNPDAKIVSALAFIWFGQAVAPNIFQWGKNAEGGDEYGLQWQFEKDSRFWCDATGVAFTMIHREVFEQMPYGEWHEDHFRHPKTGQPMGHDLAFYAMANLLGYRVRYCADAKTVHVKHIGIDEPMFDKFLEVAPQEDLG